MNAFLTGSRVYGKPRPGSDTDLVIRVDEATADRLRKLSETGKEPVKFGRLNLILCETDEEYAVWKTGTEACIFTSLHSSESGKHTPIDKREAKRIIDTIRTMTGIRDKPGSGGD